MSPATLTCTFVQGELHGPSVSYYEHIDYFFWLLSEDSHWLPDYVRRTLIQGFRDWNVWLHRAVAFEKEDPAEGLVREVFRAEQEGRAFEMTEAARASLIAAAAASAEELGLRDGAETLADRLAATGALEAYVRRGDS